MADLTAEEFVKFYYETFDGEKRDGLSTLYVCGQPQIETPGTLVADNRDNSAINQC